MTKSRSPQSLPPLGTLPSSQNDHGEKGGASRAPRHHLFFKKKQSDHDILICLNYLTINNHPRNFLQHSLPLLPRISRWPVKANVLGAMNPLRSLPTTFLPENETHLTPLCLTPLPVSLAHTSSRLLTSNRGLALTTVQERSLTLNSLYLTRFTLKTFPPKPGETPPRKCNLLPRVSPKSTVVLNPTRPPLLCTGPPPLPSTRLPKRRIALLQSKRYTPPVRTILDCPIYRKHLLRLRPIITNFFKFNEYRNGVHLPTPLISTENLIFPPPSKRHNLFANPNAQQLDRHKLTHNKSSLYLGTSLGRRPRILITGLPNTKEPPPKLPLTTHMVRPWVRPTTLLVLKDETPYRA